VDSFLLYSIHEGIRGIALDPNDNSEALMPITGTLFAVGVDFHAGNDTVYWTDMGLNRISRAKRDQTWREDVITTGINKIERINLETGESREIVLSAANVDLFSVAVFGPYIYWSDRAHSNGSIRRAFKTGTNEAATMRSGLGVNLKDVTVFNRDREKGTNPCARSNGGCQQLCFHLGSGRRTCSCAHGRLADDGFACERYEGYLLFSERTILKSIHLSDENDLNSPVQPMENPAFFKNIVALAFDYSQSKSGTNRIFFSDAHYGNIQLINDDWTGRYIIAESK
ncbi:hypothetical protein GOODEAATRI_012120, partial [Goodea atripinnis]